MSGDKRNRLVPQNPVVLVVYLQLVLFAPVVVLVFLEAILPWIAGVLVAAAIVWMTVRFVQWRRSKW